MVIGHLALVFHNKSMEKTRQSATVFLRTVTRKIGGYELDNRELSNYDSQHEMVRPKHAPELDRTCNGGVHGVQRTGWGRTVDL